MKIVKALAIALLLVPLTCLGEDPKLARELTFQDMFATRQNDTRAYVLIGSGWFRGFRFGNPGQFVSDWLAKHPAATIRPISQVFFTNTRTKKTDEMVYIWIEDGQLSLNVDLVRAGFYPGGAMADMVDSRARMDELLNDPKLAAAKAQVEKERVEAPQDRAERLVSENDYKGRLTRIKAAEAEARREKLGVWSDSMKADREAEGFP